MIFALPTSWSACEYLRHCFEFATSTNAARSYGFHRCYLCALGAACLRFGAICLRFGAFVLPTHRTATLSSAFLALLYGESGGGDQRGLAAVQSQRLRLLACSALHMSLLRKLSDHRPELARRGAVLQWLMRRVCGSRLVFSCIDLAIRARILAVNSFCQHEGQHPPW